MSLEGFEPGNTVRGALKRRRVLLGTVFATALTANTGLYAAPPGRTAWVDVLDVSAAKARIPSAAPMLRVARSAKRLVAVGERGIILFSDDNGLQWQQARVPVRVTLTGIQFTSAKRAFAIGHSGVVLRTDDAGENWQPLWDGRKLPSLLSDPEAIRQAELDGPDKPWLGLHFSDDQNGMVIGAFGLAIETDDGGQTWRSFGKRIPNPKGLHLNAIGRLADQVWIVGEQGFCAFSKDAGMEFQVLSAPYKGSFFAIHVLADGEVLLGGLRGNLLHRTRQGQFHAINSASKLTVTQLSADASQQIVLLDQSGRLFTARAPDLHFEQFQQKTVRNWHSVVQADDGGYVGAASDGVARL